jgi:hypothetical protein
MTTTKPTPPADLDSTVLHSPAEVQAWKDAHADYRNALAAIERAEEAKAKAAQEKANGVLTDEDYFEQAKKREAEKQKKLAEAAAADAARRAEKEAYMLSEPEVADVMEATEFNLLKALEHWMSRGYRVTDDSLKFWTPRLYHVQLAKPAELLRGTGKAKK